MKYDTFTRDAGVHLLQTSPWLGNGYELVSRIPMSLIPVRGRRVGKCEISPSQVMDGQILGYLNRSRLEGTFEISEVPPGWDDIEVKVQRPHTAHFPIYDYITMSEFVSERHDDTEWDVGTDPQSLTMIYYTITNWTDLLYPQGKVHVAGSLPKISGLGSYPSILSDPVGNPYALVSTSIGNPWVGSKFENAGPFVIDETKMYREQVYQDGRVIRNGKVFGGGGGIREGSLKTDALPSTVFPSTFTAVADISGATYVGNFSLQNSQEE